LKNESINKGVDGYGGVFRWAAGWLGRRAENIGAAMLAAMFIAFIIQIFFRYVLNWPVGWTTEVCTIAWLWGILWGSSFVIGEAAEIRFDIVYSSVSPKVRRVFKVITGTGLIALYLIALPDTISYINFMKVERTSYTGIRFNYLFSIYVLFVCATVVRYGWIVWRALRGSSETQSAPEV
jgi:TRAP-type C4-dicarboxylate transport system permease small subunit